MDANHRLTTELPNLHESLMGARRHADQIERLVEQLYAAITGVEPASQEASQEWRGLGSEARHLTVILSSAANQLSLIKAAMSPAAVQPAPSVNQNAANLYNAAAAQLLR